MSPTTPTPVSRLTEARKQVRIARQHLDETPADTTDLDEVAADIDRVIDSLEGTTTDGTEAGDDDVKSDGMGRIPAPGGLRGL